MKKILYLILISITFSIFSSCNIFDESDCNCSKCECSIKGNNRCNCDYSNSLNNQELEVETYNSGK